MTVDKFGRHITQKRAKKIYLVEDGDKFRNEVRQYWQEKFEKFQQHVLAHMNELPAIIARRIKQDMRCPLTYQFIGYVRSSRKFYNIAHTQHSFIEIPLDCKMHVICGSSHNLS